MDEAIVNRVNEADDGYEETMYESDPPEPGWCDKYEPHEPHVYWARNGDLYRCPGITEEELAVLEDEANEPPCEHGLSAALCNGPNHYETYDQEKARAGY